MRTRSHALAALARPLLAAGLLAGLAAVGCSSPTRTDAPLEHLTEQYRFACEAWAPGAPPVRRALFDLRLWQIDTATAPATQLVEAIEAVGGRVVYRFHGPMVRAELDVAAVPGLFGARGALNSALTVVDPTSHDVTLLVLLTGNLTADDLRAVEALGGRITNELHAIGGYAVVIDDTRVPAVRALPGVAFAGFNGTGCLA